MKTHIKIIMLSSLVLLILVCGCSANGQSPIKIFLPAETLKEEPQANNVNPKRFEQEEQSQAAAIESAMEISKKYAELSAEAAELKQQSKFLDEQNNQLRTTVKSTEVELEETQKELNEANDLIMEMRIEMNNWKADVLGFRDEMRQADIAQLQTLQRILETLGGEIPETKDSNEAPHSQ